MADGAFSNDIAYLGQALETLRLRCRARILAMERDGLIPLDPVAAVVGEETSIVDVVDAQERMQALLTEQLSKTDPKPSLIQLAESFALSPMEVDLLLMAIAPALDGTFNVLYGRLKGLNYRHHLDVDVALSVIAPDLVNRMEQRSMFSPQGNLLTHNLLRIGRGQLDLGDGFLNLEIRLPDRLVTHLLGSDDVDHSLSAFSRLIEPTETLDRVVLSPAEKTKIVSLVSGHKNYLHALDAWGLGEAIPYGRGVTMLFSGPSGTGKTLTARAVAHHLGHRLLMVDTSRLTNQAASFESNIENTLREARLQRAVLFFDECESLFHAGNRTTGSLSILLEALEQFDGVVILATNVPQALDEAVDRRILYRVDFEIPSPSMREEIWRVHLPPSLPLSDDVDVNYLGRRFEFAGGYIKNAVLLAAGKAANRQEEGEAYVTQSDLMEAAYTQLRSRLNRWADREIANLRLDDLIVTDDVFGQITEIIDAVAAQQIVFREWGFSRKFNKGRGLSALFDGEPGTGKTLSAEIISAELGMSLYRVNVANVVSKYIGETEKNLTKVFAEARGAQSVLLFDEADSLFSKRVEVKGSNDRFANMEVNVLLQLIERYEGLVILTTNLKTSLDTAFERRLSFKVNFPFPEKETRSSIWSSLIPSEAPVEEGIDYELLGKHFELSGGSIKNAVLRAAYRAAAKGTMITMDHFEDAAKRECQAAGKLYRTITVDDDW
jgi:SpoVK/Ycf46/Vps4 family AAA+-type ATPase